jgi:hypothetical protein
MLGAKRKYDKEDKEKARIYYLNHKEEIKAKHKLYYLEHKNVSKDEKFNIYKENRGTKKFRDNMRKVREIDKKIGKLKVLQGGLKNDN